ncbi:MAG TPA: hypothetical protein VGX78_04995 [Pirellulales bacterium]|jgi:hypothetical protein|nr:hypothetical protein [Pirellulales bacterium]
MSLLLGALKRLETRQSPNSRVLSLPQSATDGLRDAPAHPLAEAVTTCLESITELAGMMSTESTFAPMASPLAPTPPPESASGGVVIRSEAEKALGDDRLAQQVRRLAMDILAKFPDRPLGLAFVAPGFAAQTAELLCGLAIAMADKTKDEVLLVAGLRPMGHWSRALWREPAHLGAPLADARAPWYETIVPSPVGGVNTLVTSDANAVCRKTTDIPWEAWKRRFRCCLVETNADDRLADLLAGADGVFLTVVLRKTPRQAIDDCIARLRRVGVSIHGSVLLKA